MNKKLKSKLKVILILLVIVLGIVLINVPSVQATDTKTTIVLNQDNITVNGEEISQDESQDVYLTKKTEKNEDVAEEIENKVINITAAGTFEISGSITNAQIAVNAGDSDEVNIILNEIDITCKTAPAIIVYNAKDDQEKGQAGVVFTLASGTTNKVTGSHIPKGSSYVINGQTFEYEEKYDAAISSDVSIALEGEGKLIVDSDNEGIETKMHLTINKGTYEINSMDDSLNASEDNVSCITINGGQIYVNVKDEAEEGDGIDSNGTIYINGGVIVASAAEKSPDAGLDADLGIYINGGTVIGTGNMQSEVSSDSEQEYLQIQFSKTIEANKLIVVQSENNEIVAAIKLDKSYTNLVVSSSEIKEGTYTVYSDGTINGTLENGIYTNIESYTSGTQELTVNTGEQQGMGNMQAPGNRDQDFRNEANNSNSNLGTILLVIGGLLIIIIIFVLFKQSGKDKKDVK